MIALKNILVPTDFGEPAAAALEYGRDIARQYGASLHLLFVADDITLRYALDSPPMFLPDMQREIEADGRQRVERLLSLEDREQLRAQVVVFTSMSTATTIVDYARAQQIDLIVMGTHGRGGVSRLLMGSVAERVVRTAPCPVLTVHHPGPAPDAPAATSAP